MWKESETMDYSNAKKGINRIFTAEVLSLLGALVAAVGSVLLAIQGTTMTDAETYTSGDALAAKIILAGGVLVLIGFLFKFFGVQKAALDEAYFKKAMALIIIGFVAGIVHSATDGHIEVLSEVGNMVENICQLLSSVFIIYGVRAIAVNLNDNHVKNICDRTLKLIMLTYLLNIALCIIVMFIKNDTMAVIAGIIALAIAVLSIIASLVFLSMLNNARKMI